MPSYKLIKPVEINGAVTKNISYDFESVTGDDMKSIDKEMRSKGIVCMESAVDNEYLIAFFARAASLATEDLKNISAKDYLGIAREAKVFLLEDSGE